MRIFLLIFFDVKRSSDLQHMDIDRHVVWPWTVPDLGMADREFELWTGSNMVSSDLEFGLRDWAHLGFGRPRIGLLF